MAQSVNSVVRVSRRLGNLIQQTNFQLNFSHRMPVSQFLQETCLVLGGLKNIVGYRISVFEDAVEF